MAQVHFAITRRVKPGQEAAYEVALRQLARESLGVPGMLGVHFIGPVPGSTTGEYGILRSFESEAASEVFYQSALFQDWEQSVAHLVEGPADYRKLHGLEAFFGGTPGMSPPRWKMAIVTWIGVFPSVLLWSSLLPGVLIGLHYLAVAAIVNAFVIITLAWVVMPLLTRLFHRWLHRGSLISIGNIPRSPHTDP